jgi:predicted Fe-Mo cluster-binding NifX family protein
VGFDVVLQKSQSKNMLKNFEDFGFEIVQANGKYLNDFWKKFIWIKSS